MRSAGRWIGRTGAAGRTCRVVPCIEPETFVSFPGPGEAGKGEHGHGARGGVELAKAATIVEGVVRNSNRRRYIKVLDGQDKFGVFFFLWLRV